MSEKETNSAHHIPEMDQISVANSSLTPNEIEMFAMFKHEKWSQEKIVAHIISTFPYARNDKTITSIEVAGAGLQAIEDNPLTSEELFMFQIFEHEHWSDDRCHAYIYSITHACG